METRTLLGCAITLALLTAATTPTTAEPMCICPPSSVRADAVSEGGALNLSWDPKGTNATTFHVYLLVEGVGQVPIGIAPASAPWYVHSGLTNGVTYTYVVVSDDANGNPASVPSDAASGIPRRVPSNVDLSRPPDLQPLPAFVRLPTLDVRGTASVPNGTVEVESIPMNGGVASNDTVIADPPEGQFTAHVVLASGNNTVHARAVAYPGGPGPWSEAHTVTLDGSPPVVDLTGYEGPIENGSTLYLSAERSRDDNGIASMSWHLFAPIDLTLVGPAFAYTFHDVGSFPLVLTVVDLAGNAACETTSLTVVPFDGPPRLVSVPGRTEVTVGKTAHLDLSRYAQDDDDPIPSLDWFVSGGNDSLFTTALEGDVLSIRGMGDGEAVLHLYVTDTSGKSDSGSIVVSVRDTRTDRGSGLVLIALLALCGGGITAFGMAILRRRSPTRAVALDGGDAPFFAKGVYLIHNDGRLMRDEWAVSGGIKDPDMVGAMFTAIQEFVSSSFEGNASIDTIKFGDDNLTITRGHDIYLATVSIGPVSPEFRDSAKAVTRRIEAEYAGIIEDWDGSQARLHGLGPILRQLLEAHGTTTPEEATPKPATGIIVTTPSVEFHHGLVCYKLVVENQSGLVLVDASVTAEWDKNVLLLKQVSTEEERTGSRFYLGNVPNGESRTLELCFDPQTCLQSYVRGLLVYTDVRGKLQTVTLESTLVEVNCPIFFTVGNANTAMLHRLIDEELEHKDNKVLRYTRVIDSGIIYRMVKSVLAGYDIAFVQEFINETPFIGEAWYYGETKIYDYKVVVRATVREADNSVEFFVAATLPMTITGLLAELSRMFIMKLDEKYTHGYNVRRVVTPSVNSELSETYRTEPTLFERTVSGAVSEHVKALKEGLAQELTLARGKS
jgi:hypothetical protein